MSRINPAAAIAAVAAALAVGTVHTPASSAADQASRPPSVKVTRATVIRRRGRWIRNGPMWPSAWPTWPGGNTRESPRCPLRRAGSPLAARLIDTTRK